MITLPLRNAAPTLDAPHSDGAALTLLRHCRGAVRIASLLTFAVGLLVLFGWLFDVAALKSVMPGAATMKPNTALCFALAGMALWALYPGAGAAGTDARQRLGFACALLVSGMAWLTLGEYLFGFNAGIDTLLYPAAAFDTHASYTGRMAPATAVAFGFAGSALLLLKKGRRPGLLTSQCCAFATALIGLTAALGYAYGVEDLYRFYSYSSMAPHTAALFIVLGFGMLLARPDYGFAAILVHPDSGGFLARRILPVAVLAPLFLGWLLLLGEHAGYYGTAFGLTLFASSNVALFILLVWFSARSLNRKDAERRSAEEASRQSGQRLRNIIDGLGPNIFVGLLTTEGIVLEANQQALTAAGLKAEDVLGKPVEETYWFNYSEESKQQMRATIARAAQGEAVRYDVWIRATENHFIPLDFSVQPFRDTAGKVVLLVPSSIVIAERKQAEAALRESESHFRTLFEQATDGILVCGAAGYFLDANPAACQMLGYSREELFKLKNTDIVMPEEVPRTSQEMARMQDGGVVVRSEWRLRRRDGSTLLAELGARPLPNGNVQEVIRDITARRHAEDALRQLTQELEQRVSERTAELQAIQRELRAKNQELEDQNQLVQKANRLKSEFLANMSHELRTPLNAIIGFSELMHDGKTGAVASHHKEYLGDILTSGKHLLQLINGVLDLAKVESGKMEFHPEPVNLAKIAGEVRDVLRTLMANKRIDVAIEVDPALTGVVADPVRLKQVLYNYLSNALKFSPTHGHVTVRARAEDARHYRLEVEDQGIGIYAEHQHQLFVEFQQLDPGTAKKYAGTGLGLALTKRIVEAQSGWVGVVSAPHQGSVFYAVLPRAPHADGPLEARSP